MVLPVADQKAITLVKFLVEQLGDTIYGCAGSWNKLIAKFDAGCVSTAGGKETQYNSLPSPMQWPCGKVQ